MADELERACPNCGSKNIESQGAAGNSVCTECGVILEENAIVSHMEFVEGAGGSSSMVGQFVSATSRKAYTGGGGRGGGNYGFSRDSRETTLANGRRRIQEVASRLRLGGHYIDAAHRLFTIAVEKNFVQGRRTIHVVAACLYISCRQEKSQHMLIDFSDALQVNVYTLGTCFLKFRRLLGLKLAILDPALYIYRFAAHLDLDNKANEVALTALRLVGRMKRDWIVAGRRPAGICAAALLIASRAHGFSRHEQDVTRILRVCGMTVNTRVKEFEQTPSAALTLEQFNKVELENEADPPAFTKNRILEARARAIEENNVELLTSGALDDPMKSKRYSSKWRDTTASSEKTEAFERLYKSLEKQMGNKKNEKDDDDGEANENDENDGEGNEDDGDKLESEEAVRDTEKDGAEQADEQEQDAVKGKSPEKNPESENPDDGLSKAEENQIVPSTNIVASKWEKAYPKSNSGKKLILPDHATPEERLPPTQPVEGTLDVTVWRKDMPRDMVDDIESMFRNPTEIAQKEAIFNKINKDYIILEAQKKKNRDEADQAVDDADKDLIEQAQGMERYRKRKGRSKDGTTEEALLEAVANRKISRKINYDAMSSIFDDGSFSGGTGLEDPFAAKESTGMEEI
mmetsp:Transcript_9516/g.28366  ORF Transcript_9516/g.28366 Transcript_9516/m.28366 type:complete len:632 (-) Transcript_9516:1158-3053(-)|eukprot:CAMPEP_0172372190 /NCGR_PEP_ID=MMETSP1060-20121228/46416_1 /TAXON_ID=37318 /ORGANISM="Pseudo-nitzschia pungens, Strain cf. cingulata" /LENGTH=631 /DNA_ID=CAMNT_0013098077 /DNA_START=70 /DNA_END=1965 /DNA_ORIENTATION=-